jgi:RNA polymerase sigma factor (sigma-70 family)
MTLPAMTHDLTAVLQGARQGDQTAFEQLLQHEQEFLAAQVQRQLDSGLRAVLGHDDVLQEARMRIVRSVEQADFASQAAFRAWIATIVRNVVIDLRRRHFMAQKRAGAPISLDEGAATSQSGVTTSLIDRIRIDEPGPSSIVRRKEDVSLLEQALEQLKPHHREVLHQVHYERLRLSDIAARTGRKPATVRKELARALIACRKVLDRMQGRTGEQDA